MAGDSTRPPPLRRVLFAVVAPLQAFFRLQAAGGIVLIVSALVAVVWANSPWAARYAPFVDGSVQISFYHWHMGGPLRAVVNEGLMTAFFLLAGLEIKRELVTGELRTARRAALPLVAAAGGMLVPAALYVVVNRGGPGQPGWGIPMATDIAFALGILTLVKSRVAPSLVVFLTALAIFDDLGAILVITLFYGGGVHAMGLVLAGAMSVILFVLARMRVQSLWLYAIVGALLWIVLHASGMHGTLAGVILGLAVPATSSREPKEVLDDLEAAVHELREADGVPAGTLASIERHLESVQPPLDRLVHGLEGVVAFAIVPLFALVNAGVTVHGSLRDALHEPITLGVMLGLIVGKAVGVFGTTWLAVKLGLAPMPTRATYTQLLGVAILAGIGFTMSIFVANLAFGEVGPHNDEAKVGVLAASTVCAIAGALLLRFAGGKTGQAARDVDVTVPGS